MPSSYTSSLKLTLPQTGDLIGSWGGVVNSGVTSLVDQAVAGSVTITMTPDTNYTLTSTNGASDEARNMFINVTGGPHTLTKNVVCPSVSKLFVVTNNTSGGQDILFKTSAGTGVTIPNGVRAVVYCDGTNVGLVNMISLVDTATIPFTGSLALTSLDAGITTVADTAGFSGFSVFVDGTAENTTVGMHGDTASGTTAGVNNASLGVLSFNGASAGLINTTFAGAPLYFATSNGVQMEIGDNTGVTLYGNGTEGGQLALNNPNDASVGGTLDVSVSDTLRLFTSRNNSAIQIGQIGAGLTGGAIGFYTENTEKMRITNTGNVGIGLNNPTEKLVVVGNAYLNSTAAGGGVYTLIYNASSAANSYSQLALWNDNGFSTNSADLSFYSSSGSHSSAAANELRLRNGANAPVTIYTANTERMRITGAGNVGIGTSSPGQKLTVAGTIESTTGGVKYPDGGTVTSSLASAKAWVVINVTDWSPVTVSVLAQYNVTSVTWNTTSPGNRFQVNFTTPFANANYAKFWTLQFQDNSYEIVELTGTYASTASVFYFDIDPLPTITPQRISLVFFGA